MAFNRPAPPRHNKPQNMYDRDDTKGAPIKDPMKPPQRSSSGSDLEDSHRVDYRAYNGSHCCRLPTFHEIELDFI
jgi:hypothetical protein